jgi:hypothetical protein
MNTKARAPVTLLFILLFVVATFTQSGVKHIMGTIQEISADSITLETAGDNPITLTIALMPSTRVLEDGADVSQKELRVGSGVLVSAKAKADRLDAITVIVGKQRTPTNTSRPRPRVTPAYVSA